MTVSAASPVATPAASTSSVSAASATAATQSLSYNDFLTLLMAEMKNQDPTQPMDPSQMVSQLATVQSAIWMVVVGAGPCVGAAMAVGVVIALLQALTQIQEMTLTFVPKMIAVFVAASLTASFVGAKFSIFTESVYARIEQGYK